MSERRTFTITLWVAGQPDIKHDYEADDSVHASALGIAWAKKQGFTLRPYTLYPPPNGKGYTGMVGPTQKDAFIQMYEIAPLKTEKRA